MTVSEGQSRPGFPKSPWTGPAAPQGPDRNRLADFLRVFAIACVVLGHWLVAVVLFRDSELVVTRLLVVMPEIRWLTWVFQVMPLFFLVGGFANAGSWDRATARGEKWPAWVARRAQRVLAPLPLLVGVWVGLVAILPWAGLAEDTAHLASRAAFLPIWFIGIYLLVVASVPLTLRWHRAQGARAVLVLALLAGLVDTLTRMGVPWVAFANAWIVWATIHQVGYAWHDRGLPMGVRAGVPLMVAGLTALLVLVGFVGYPVSMVTVGEGVPTNAGPPTVALLALALTQMGIVISARRPLEAWLRRPRPWAAIAASGRVVLPAFYWHMTAMIVVSTAAYRTGFHFGLGSVDAAWWVTRPLWLALYGAVLVVLVAVFRPLEPQGSSGTGATVPRTILGLGSTLFGIHLLITEGLYPLGSRMPVALATILTLAIGLTLLGMFRRARAGQAAR